MSDTTTETRIEHRYIVTFIGAYFTLSTHIFAENEEQAVDNADALIGDYYGWNVKDASKDISVEDTGDSRTTP